MLTLEGAHVLPFSPTILSASAPADSGAGATSSGRSSASFGGRTDLDADAYWTLQNLGVGNLALIDLAGAGLG